jgi:hypothetical protein
MICDTTWKCGAIHFVYKLFGSACLLVLSAIIRKLASRLQGSATATKEQQVPPVQMALSGAFAVSSALVLAFPNVRALAAIELCIITCLAFSGWVHYLVYALASKKAFSVVLSTPPSTRITSQKRSTLSPEQPRRLTQSPEQQQRIASQFSQAKRAKKNLGFNVRLCVVMISFIYLGMGIGLTSLWPVNRYSGACRGRSAEDAPHAIESLRFYICDVFVVIVIVSMWHTIFVFNSSIKKKREKMKSAKGKAVPSAAATAEGSYANTSTLES